MYNICISLVWYPGQNKRIAPDSSMDAIKSEKRNNSIHLSWTAIRRRWAYHLLRLQYSSKLSNFNKTLASRKNISDTSANPLGIKREWYL
jgi:hypothetical protein